MEGGGTINPLLFLCNTTTFIEHNLSSTKKKKKLEEAIGGHFFSRVPMDVIYLTFSTGRIWK